MDEQAKKTALRMIPYGLFVLGAGEGLRSTVSTVNWVTQASFAPPLVAVGVKADSGTFRLIQETQKFAVSVLGTGQKDLAFSFFKHVEPADGAFSGYPYETHTTGAPILSGAPAWFECAVESVVEGGDHALVVGRVVEAGVREQTKPLTLDECGVQYGG
ncbi:MAG: flavin reductase family protein [Dehalococcoidia bacterium]|nr:flavin reductase family protein [Chloroflexi bacterium CFX7]MCK6564197.1 flavin reductase family protein [Dehalococcoidia bacterium]NUQ54712.1 flavin reductase family protein [Dehalococcoidia bacterium]